MSHTMDNGPIYDFISHTTVSKYQVPVQTFLANERQSHKDLKYGYLACGALVLDDSPNPRILLIQRASSDSMPNLWETPGGGCDDEDASIIYSVARELWEETGLLAESIGPRVGDDHVFATRSGNLVYKLNFLVKTKKGENGSLLRVKLDPKEHQNHVWATEEDVKAHKSGDIELRITTKTQEALILEAFNVVKKIGETHTDSLSR